MVENKLCLSVREISEQMGISLPKTYELTRRHDFPKIMVGRRCVVPRDSFIAWLEKSATAL